MGIVGAAAVWASMRARPATPPLRITRAIMPLPAGASLHFDATSSLALSPDGTRVAYVMTHGSSSQIYLRSLDEFEAKPIAGTEGADGPFSPRTAGGSPSPVAGS